VIGGAGIDPGAFSPRPLPDMPPLRVAVVARMLWSKGIDIAVEAARLARAQGAPVELALYGAPDPSNRRAIGADTLRGWSRDGVAWHGATADVSAVWASHHVACLPSRGGEGLPRALLEAASCGRALVATDVPGCRSLVRDGVEGLLVPPEDAPALARAFVRLSAEPALVAAFGAAARARIETGGFTEAAVSDGVRAVWRELLEA
jgi:glycosyltransferase involved in cell wall biosynthesis